MESSRVDGWLGRVLSCDVRIGRGTNLRDERPVLRFEGIDRGSRDAPLVSRAGRRVHRATVRGSRDARRVLRDEAAFALGDVRVPRAERRVRRETRRVVVSERLVLVAAYRVKGDEPLVAKESKRVVK